MGDTTGKKMTDEEFEKAYGYCWDYCMVFTTKDPSNTENPEPSHLCVQTVQKLEEAGLDTMCFYSYENDEVYCKIRAPLPRLQKFADYINQKVLLNSEALKEAAEGGNEEYGIKPFKINDEGFASKYKAYDFIYAKYDDSPDLRPLYQLEKGGFRGSFQVGSDEELTHPFRATLRLQLTEQIIAAKKDKGGAGLKPRYMLHHNEIRAFFPLHDEEQKKGLEAKWIKARRGWLWEMPFMETRHYFGEQIGMYFQFLGHYTKWIAGPSLIGAILYIIMLAQGRTEGPESAAFAILICIWTISMLEFWKRRQARIQLHWGMRGIEKNIQDRPEFVGEQVTSPIDGRPILYFPPNLRYRTMAATQSIALTFVVLVLALVGAIFWFRFYLTNTSRHGQFAQSNAAYIGSALNGLQISLMNLLYEEVAIRMTNLENHRTDIHYQDSLITKLFLFQFVNSYSSFFYIAFIQNQVDGCDGGSCMRTLAKNLGIIFLVQLVVGNVQDIVVPYVRVKKRLRDELDDIRNTGKTKGASPVEYEYTLDTYDNIMGPINDYISVAIQFGYLSLFVAAFPLAPLMALANNYVSIHADVYRLLNMMRRPVPLPSSDIGNWQEVMTILAIIAVVTNSALLCFIMENVFDSYSWRTRLWIFVAMQYVIFSSMYVVQLAVPDVPSDVNLQHERAKLLAAKIVDRVADEDEDPGVDEVALESFKLTVHAQDTKLATIEKNVIDRMLSEAERVGHGLEAGIAATEAATDKIAHGLGGGLTLARQASQRGEGSGARKNKRKSNAKVQPAQEMEVTSVKQSVDSSKGEAEIQPPSSDDNV